MQDLALDPLDGDLDLSTGGARLTRPGGESAGQWLTIRLRRWRGEYPLDTRGGMPYATILGTKDTPASPGGPRYLEAVLRDSISTCPGVASLDAFRLEVDGRRNAVASFAATGIDGEPINPEPFTVGET